MGTVEIAESVDEAIIIIPRENRFTGSYGSDVRAVQRLSILFTNFLIYYKGTIDGSFILPEAEVRTYMNADFTGIKLFDWRITHDMRNFQFFLREYTSNDLNGEFVSKLLHKAIKYHNLCFLKWFFTMQGAKFTAIQDDLLIHSLKTPGTDIFRFILSTYTREIDSELQYEIMSIISDDCRLDMYKEFFNLPYMNKYPKIGYVLIRCAINNNYEMFSYIWERHLRIPELSGRKDLLIRCFNNAISNGNLEILEIMCNYFHDDLEAIFTEDPSFIFRMFEISEYYKEIFDFLSYQFREFYYVRPVYTLD